MINYLELAGKCISTLNAYKPGKPIDELKREFNLKKIIKLASNENPLGPSPKVLEAIKNELKSISRYPLGDAYNLRVELAKHLNVENNNLVFGSGSNEIIELLIRTFLKPNEHTLSPNPSFSVYSIISQAMSSQCKLVDTEISFKIDPDKIINAVTPKTRVLFLANPNNPTGSFMTNEELVYILKNTPENLIVVMDEAYIEFADAKEMPNSLELQKTFPNLTVMRTFSKAYGLAGLRIGYCVAHKDCCDMINRVRQPFNTSSIAQIAATESLKDKEWLKKVIDNNTKGKEFLYKCCSELKLPYIETQANFMLINVGNGEKVFQDLLKKGVIVRYMGGSLENYIRVSIGTPEENSLFIEKLKEII